MKFKLFTFLVFFSTFCLAQVPTITSFSPTSAEVGDTVTITGTGFDATASNNIVYFGGVKANMATASETQLEVIVPKGVHAERIHITNTSTNLVVISGQRFVPKYQMQSFFTEDSYSSGSFYLGAVQERTRGDAYILHDLNDDGKIDFLFPDKSGSTNTLSYIQNNTSNLELNQYHYVLSTIKSCLLNVNFHAK